jgi:hypothetical protein
MTPTETGVRCEPCTDALCYAADGPECDGCDFKIAGRCITNNAAQCPITAPRPTGRSGPTTIAEVTRIRARFELAAVAMRAPCPDCGSTGRTWEARDRRTRIGVLLTCSGCGAVEHDLLTRDTKTGGLYRVAVQQQMISVVRQPSSWFYRLDAIEAFAVTENEDHDVLTFRTCNEVQCFAVEDAEPVVVALTKVWGMP